MCDKLQIATKRRKGAEVLILLEGDISDVDIPLEESDDETEQLQPTEFEICPSIIPHITAVSVEQAETTSDDDVPLADRNKNLKQKEAVSRFRKKSSLAHVDQLQSVLNAAARLIGGIPKFGHISEFIRAELHWLPTKWYCL